MRRTVFIGLIVLLAATPSFGQRLLSRWVAPNVPFLLVNPQSGATTTFGPTLAPAFTYPFLEAFDAARQRLYFVSGSGVQLESFDLRTGNIAVIPGPTRLYDAVEYDSLTDRIIAVVTMFPVPVVSIDPASGAATPIATVNTTAIRFGVSAIDVPGRRFFFLTGNAPDEITTVNLATQNVTSVPMPSAARAFFEYDPVTGGVLSAPGSDPNPSIFVIDPATGSQTVLFTGAWPAAAVPSVSVSAFDPSTRRLYFVGVDSNTFPFQQTIVTADLTAQTVVAHDVGPGALSFLELAPVPVPAMGGPLLAALGAALAFIVLYALRARV